MQVELLHTNCIQIITYKFSRAGYQTRNFTQLCELKKCTYEYKSQVFIDSLITALTMKQ